MSLLKWSDTLKIGVGPMDDEHQHLVQLMNTLHEHHESGAPKAVVMEALAALCDYTIKHFEDEEAYLRSIDYADYRVHCITHQHLVTKLTGFRDAYVSGASGLDDSFFSFLKLWLSAHILQIDKKYAALSVAA